MDFDFFMDFDIDENRGIGKLRNFSRWSELPTELKMTVVNNLDFCSKMRLSCCSRQDYNIVHSSKFEIKNIAVKELSEKSIVEVQFWKNNDFFLRLNFEKCDENHTLISWKKRENRNQIRKSEIFENCNYYEEALRFVEKWLKYDIDIIYAMMDQSPPATKNQTSIQKIGKCREMKFFGGSEMMLKWWLELVQPTSKFLQIAKKESDSLLSSQWFSITNDVFEKVLLPSEYLSLKFLYRFFQKCDRDKRKT